MFGHGMLGRLFLRRTLHIDTGAICFYLLGSIELSVALDFNVSFLQDQCFGNVVALEHECKARSSKWLQQCRNRTALVLQSCVYFSPAEPRQCKNQETAMDEHCATNAAALARQCINSTEGLQHHCGSLLPASWSRRSDVESLTLHHGSWSHVTSTTGEVEQSPSSYVKSAYEALSHLRQGNLAANGITVQEFPHDSIPIRGLGARKNFSLGEPVIIFRKKHILQASDLQDARFRGASNTEARVGLWLAEKKTELLDRRKEVMTRQEEIWTGWVKAYPTYEDLAGFQQPYFTPQEVLNKWAKLPRLSEFPNWTATKLDELKEDIRKYNMARGVHPRMEWSSALWGKAISHRHCFFCPEFHYSAILLPVGDLVNHGGSKANVRFRCDAKGQFIAFQALRDIRAGEEILDTYGHLDPQKLAWYMGAFADVGEYQVEWPLDDCRQLWVAGYGSGRVQSPHDVEKLMDKVVRWLCRKSIDEFKGDAA